MQRIASPRPNPWTPNPSDPSAERLNLGVPTPYYQCVTRPLEASAVPDSAMCGGLAQECCDEDPTAQPTDSKTRLIASRCGHGLACNLEPNADGKTLCEACGGQDERCCFSKNSDVAALQCNAGLGCTNNVGAWNDRRCVECGGTGQPACWSAQVGGGHYCNEGVIGGALLLSGLARCWVWV